MICINKKNVAKINKPQQQSEQKIYKKNLQKKNKKNEINILLTIL